MSSTQAWVSLSLVGAAAGVFAVVGGRIVGFVLGDQYHGEVGRQVGHLVVYLSPWMVAWVVFAVTFPLVFVADRRRALVPLALVGFALCIPLGLGLRSLWGLAGIAACGRSLDPRHLRRAVARSCRGAARRGTRRCQACPCNQRGECACVRSAVAHPVAGPGRDSRCRRLRGTDRVDRLSRGWRTCEPSLSLVCIERARSSPASAGRTAPTSPSSCSTRATRCTASCAAGVARAREPQLGTRPGHTRSGKPARPGLAHRPFANTSRTRSTTSPRRRSCRCRGSSPS